MRGALYSLLTEYCSLLVYAPDSQASQARVWGPEGPWLSMHQAGNIHSSCGTKRPVFQFREGHSVA